MTQTTDLPLQHRRMGLSRLKLFFALSRTPHGLLDMTTPVFGALLCLGALPAAGVIVIGLITAFAGYTAVYALNDVVDFANDREKFKAGHLPDAGGDLDAVLVRHPMAQGLLPYGWGVAWAAGWATVALIGAALLNPVCIYVFIAGCVLETVYCRLWQVSPFRTVVSGCVKTLGAVAAVFAVNPAPSPPFLMVLFLCLFLWEIGGQNIPNDWTDMADDRVLGGRTVPLCYGTALAGLIAVLCLCLSTALGVLLFAVSVGGYGWPSLLTVAGIGLALLVLPAARLYRTADNAHAMDLFNRASYYPPALLCVVLVNLWW